MSEIVLAGIPADDIDRFRTALAKITDTPVVLNGDIGADHFAKVIAGERPAVVAFGPDLDGADRFDLTRALVEIDPTIGVLIVGKPSEELVLQALDSGARGVLHPDSSAGEIRTGVERVLEASRRLRQRLETPDPDANRKRTIVVVSAKGGAGKTVVAVNLAAAIALEHPRQTAIIDLDFQFGDVATALLLAPVNTILDATDASDLSTMGATALKVFLTRHAPTELFALCSPDDPAAGEEITPRMVGDIIDALGREFQYQVVDTSAGLGEHMLAALERATDIVVVVDLDVPSVRGGHKLIQALDVCGLRQATRHVVLNRADSKVGLTVDEVAAALEVPIDIMLPSTRNVPISYNEGRPLVVAKPRFLFSRRINDLACRLVAGGVRTGGTDEAR